ncbi:MAG: efflux RND transporter periplasmic adaptor subunit [bacterium]
MKTRFFLKSITALSLLLIVSCQGKKEQKTEEREVLAENAIELNADQYANAGILLGKVDQQLVSAVLKVNGTVNVTPQNLASVSAPLGGFVKSTSLVQGIAVAKGQNLATIENFTFIEIQQNYLETKAKYQYAETEFRRHSELYKDQVYSEKNVQQTETEYKTLKAQLKGLEQKLIALGIDPETLTEDRITSLLPVVAPIGGYIKSVNINIGKYISPSDVLCEIVNPANVILELVVFEKDVQKVSNGQKVTFSSPNEPGKAWTGVIYQAGKALDNDKTTMVYASIDNPRNTLLSGMYVNGEIQVSNNNAWVLPQDAVVQFNGRFFIFIYKGIRAENGKQIHDFLAIEVGKGPTDRGFTEIVLPEGFEAASEQVVIKGAYTLLSAWKNAGEMAC